WVVLSRLLNEHFRPESNGMDSLPGLQQIDAQASSNGKYQYHSGSPLDALEGQVQHIQYVN
ncbi:MAG: hypothetical protein WBN81_07645, partial [Gammaproteobacteria bacterium]